MNDWDIRYQDSEYFYGESANDFLRLCLPHLKASDRLVSLGEGEGRNALALLEAGILVDAIDGSEVAKNKAQSLCAKYGEKLAYYHLDLENWQPEEASYDAALLIWCHLPTVLRQQVHSKVVSSLKPGGLVIFEAYRPEQINFGTGGPKNLDMLMTAAALKREFSGLEPIVLQETTREVHEGKGHFGMSATIQLLARKK